jgi:pimeloyl-ACP methyl ester carboxylesterase
VSPDPTPRHPLGLELAAIDPAPNLLYLARPCQYTSFDIDRRCSAEYWTSKRFSEEVIAATNQAIDQFAKNAPGVRLVGYSGGAAVAVLVAARRHDVIDLRTIAGNLDHVVLNRLHDVTPLSGSLNAADVAPRLADLPQLHFVGDRDKIVPPQVTESYLSHLGDRRCTKIRTVANATHDDGWVDVWPASLRVKPTC